jgi:hypothetical protein
MTKFSVRVEGMDIITRNVRALGDDLPKYMAAAGDEIGAEILDTPGLRKYPPTSAANAPGRTREVMFAGAKKPAVFRQSYYIRGRGLMVPVRGGSFRQTASSERYGSRWMVRTKGTTTTISNSASYALYLAGDDDQAAAMAALGWRKLGDVAQEKIEKVRAVYQRWVDKLIRDKGLS